jgi:hypothetical protein
MPLSSGGRRVWNAVVSRPVRHGHARRTRGGGIRASPRHALFPGALGMLRHEYDTQDAALVVSYGLPVVTKSGQATIHCRFRIRPFADP